MALTLVPLASHAATLAGWDASTLPGGTNNFGPSPYAATTTSSNITVGGLTRGSGVGTTGSGAGRAWGGNNFYDSIGKTTSTRATALAAGQYVTFSVTANSANQVSFSSISKFSYRRSGTGPTSGVLQYQLGPDPSPFVDVANLNYPTSTSSGDYVSPIDLSGVAALQNVAAGVPVTFRIVNWGGTGSTGTWYVFDKDASTASDLEVQGTVSPVPTTQVRVETAADGSGVVVPAQSLPAGSSLTVYAIGRNASGGAPSNIFANWSLVNVTGSIVSSDLIPAADGKSAVFTPHGGGSAVIHASSGNFSSVDSGVITAVAQPTPPSATALAAPAAASAGDTVLLTVAVTPGGNPSSTNLLVTGDLSQVGGSANTVFHDDGILGDATAGDNVFSYELTLPAGVSNGQKTLPITVVDAQARTAAAAISLRVVGQVTIFHVNDVHARVTPHKWIIPAHGTGMGTFEDVGGAAYLTSAMLSLTAAQPSALVIDAGDISEGNPLGDMGGNAAMVQIYEMLSAKLQAQRGRGMDAVLVGNHDVRSADYIANLVSLQAAGVPVISANLRDKTTHLPYFAPYTIVEVNGTRVGLLGYTTDASEVGASLADTLEVDSCDWNSTDSTKIHLSSYVNELRNTQGCDMVVLVAHVGDSVVATSTSRDGDPVSALLADDGAAKLPEVAVTGHWHTWAETVWQPESLNYKTIITESNSYMHYIGELQVSGAGRYLGSQEHVIRDADFTADADVNAYITQLAGQWDAAHPTLPLEGIIGYTADDLLLDDRMKWWSADEYPWSGDNSAGQWICDAMQWKATQLFGQCDLAMETGGGVRADIPAGPVTYRQIYETFPWSDDTFYRVNMTGQEIINFLEITGCDAGFSRGLEVVATDGIPVSVTFNGAPIDVLHTYTVAINSFMYAHPPSGWTWSDPSPLTSTNLCRDGLVDFMRNFTQQEPYTVGGPRYELDTDFSGGYRAVVTMMNDNDTRPAYEDAFIRLLGATTETLAHRGTAQVPSELVGADGSVNPAHSLSEQELYRSYLGFKAGVLHPGDILEVWGKGSFYRGNPEFVDQEGIYGDGIEFKIVGHDESLAKPAFMPSIRSFWDDFHKNHYVKFLARKASASTVVDQYGQTITLWDDTGYTAMSGVPGNVGDLLIVTGIATMENYALRFRCQSAVLASTQGIADFPAQSTVASRVDPVFPFTTAGQVTLHASASPSSAVWTLGPVADAQVASLKPTTNYGSSKNLYLQSSSSGYGDERAWLRFDLSGLPAGAIVTRASLDLWCWSAAGPALAAEVRGAADGWTESGLTWSTQTTVGTVLSTQDLAAGTENLWYAWDVTEYVQMRWDVDKIASLVVKPVSEGSSANPAPSYAFDSKEYGSTAPFLSVTTSTNGGSTVAGIGFYYRYSSDDATWGSWTLAGTCAAASCAQAFAFPQGYGYYEFYTLAQDGAGGSEPAPAGAESFVHYTPVPPYPSDAYVTLSQLAQVYDGTPKAVGVTTLPPAIGYGTTYAGGPQLPVHAGSYPVSVTVTQAGYTGSASDLLTIQQAAQQITFDPVATVPLTAGTVQLHVSASSSLPVQVTSSNPAVAQVSGTTVTLLAAGTVTLTATQAGNGDYLAATPATRALKVTTAPDSGPTPTSAPAMPFWALVALAMALAWIVSSRLRIRF